MNNKQGVRLATPFFVSQFDERGEWCRERRAAAGPEKHFSVGSSRCAAHASSEKFFRPGWVGRVRKH